MKRSLLVLASSIAFHAYAETGDSTGETVVEHPPAPITAEPTQAQRAQPEKVYVEGSYSTRPDEHCVFSEEHDHIHCYDQETTTRTVYVDEPTTVIRRHTRYDPISTGVGIGLAIGLPILVHHAIHDRHDKRHYKRHHKRHYNRHDKRHYSHHYGPRYDGYYKSHFRGYKRHDRKHRRHDRHERKHERRHKRGGRY